MAVPYGSNFRRLSLALVWVLTLAGLLQLPAAAQPPRQDDFGNPNDPSPAVGHTAIIAHGVERLPAGDVVWQITNERAALSNRSTAVFRPAGFVLADAGVVAVTDRFGLLLARVAPGEADWIPPDRQTAIVSLEQSATTYSSISLVPAADLVDSDNAVSSTDFTLPPNVSLDVVLLRDVLSRNEETDVDSGVAPGLLLVTSGTVTVEAEDGDTIDLAAGDATEIDGEAIVVGTSRALATFVVAQLGPEVPDQVTLRQTVQPTVAPVSTPTPTPVPTRTPIPTATSTPVATRTPIPTPTATATATPSPSQTPRPTATPSPTRTPIPTPTPTPTVVPVVPATVGISSFICPVEYDGSDFAVDCTNPATGVEFTVSQNDAVVQSAPADANGSVAFADLDPGDYVLAGGIPGDFASSRVRCLNASGEDIARRHATNQIAVTLEAGDDILCNWYIVPVDARGEQTSLTVDIRACPEGMRPESLVGDVCDPAPAGTTLTLRLDGEPLGVASATASAWVWDDLDPASYTLDVNAIPPEFVDVQLDDQACCGASADFSIELPEGAGDARRTLYLFLPEAPQSTLAVALLACPPGMTGETLDPDACEPASQGIELTLLLDGAVVPPAVANAPVWEWEELGPYRYGLDVDAPDTYSEFQLDDQACCGVSADFAVQMPKGFVAAERTLYLFQPDEAELPQPATDGSISVYVHACPPGMTVDTLVDAECTDSPPGVSFSLFADDTPLGVTTVADDLWTWEGLPYREFDLFVNAIPDGYVDYSLGIRECCNERGGLTVATSAETPDTGYILHLYQPGPAPTPPAPEPEAESEEPASEELVSPLQVVDPDGDGLPTTDEVGFFNTDPENPDTDGDGVNDDDEIAAGTDPLDG